MNLIYASTFTDALTKLTQAEAGAAIQVAIRFASDPRGNGLQMHRIDKAEGFWSMRVSRDLRIILYRLGEATLLAYVGHHDDAYSWAERKRLVPHERTGAMQFVEVPIVAAAANEIEPAHKVQQVTIATEPTSALPFGGLTDDQLLNVGVPRDWIQLVRETQDVDLFVLLDRLPAEAAEALLDHATGGQIDDHVALRMQNGDPFAHPDAQRRFRTVENLDELRAALEFPWEKWTVFLHPVQRALVERNWLGPVRVGGTAGTGKTIVALHRSVYTARSDASNHVLLTTFSKPLAQLLAAKRDILIEAEPNLRQRLAVASLDEAAYELYKSWFGAANMATANQIRALIRQARDSGLGSQFTPEFLFEEWAELVDAWDVVDADTYAELPRLGRRIRMGSRQREAAWAVFEFLRQRMEERNLTTWSQLYSRLREKLHSGYSLPYTHIVVDEAQDLSVAQARFLSTAGSRRPDALYLTGDIGQRIFHLPMSWARLGLDIRGRSHRLKVNYRTSHQIRSAADQLLPSVIVDGDGEEESRRGTVSVFDGPDPEVLLVPDVPVERSVVADFLRRRRKEGVVPSQIGVLVRSQGQLARARMAVKAAGESTEGEDAVAIRTMHEAKGLEFRAVAVVACDQDVLPDPTRLAGIGDSADMEAAYETERHLLYVACTRARDYLLVTAVAPGSEFLKNLRDRP
jgi:hypothetical protein